MQENHLSLVDKKAERFQDFTSDLQELCIKNQVCLAPSGYDALQVWNLSPDEKPFDDARLENCIPHDV